MEPNKLSFDAELPEPMGEVNTEVLTVPTPEAAQNYSQPSAASVQPMAPPTMLATPVAPAQQQATPPVPVAADPIIADDADLIEKEWVLKAKAIVAQTAHDPSLQTKEIGKVKADYLKKRYNKILKLDES